MCNKSMGNINFESFLAVLNEHDATRQSRRRSLDLPRNRYGFPGMWSPPMLCSVYVSHTYTLETDGGGVSDDSVRRAHRISRTQQIKAEERDRGGMRNRSGSNIQHAYLGTDNLVYERFPWNDEEMSLLLVCTRKTRSRSTTMSYQMNSEQIEQNVGCRKKVAMNLCPLISYTRRTTAKRRCANARLFCLKCRSLLTARAANRRRCVSTDRERSDLQSLNCPCSSIEI